MWYNQPMKKETIKEIGKLFLDFTKIIFAIAFLTPFIKNGDFEILPIISGFSTAIVGIYLTNKGLEDE